MRGEVTVNEGEKARKLGSLAVGTDWGGAWRRGEEDDAEFELDVVCVVNLLSFSVFAWEPAPLNERVSERSLESYLLTAVRNDDTMPWLSVWDYGKVNFRFVSELPYVCNRPRAPLSAGMASLEELLTRDAHVKR